MNPTLLDTFRSIRFHTPDIYIPYLLLAIRTRTFQAQGLDTLLNRPLFNPANSRHQEGGLDNHQYGVQSLQLRSLDCGRSHYGCYVQHHHATPPLSDVRDTNLVPHPVRARWNM